LPLTGCVLRNAAEVEAFAAERPTWGDEVVAWCLGGETASRARETGWRRVVETAADTPWATLVDAMEGRREGTRTR
jgi:uroporphyrinogen-III synthase